MHNFRKEITLKENSFNFSLLFIKVNAYRVGETSLPIEKWGSIQLFSGTFIFSIDTNINMILSAQERSKLSQK